MKGFSTPRPPGNVSRRPERQGSHPGVDEQVDVASSPT
jgi:hypothetical protein